MTCVRTFLPSTPIRHRLPFVAPTLAACLLLVAGATAAQAQEVLPVTGCNSQLLGDGTTEVFWTSTVSTSAYGFVEEPGSRAGPIVSGEGDRVQVSVQWSGGTQSQWVAFGLRGAGFSPGGVSAVLDTDGPVQPLPDPSFCPDVDPTDPSYGSFTLFMTFTELHKPARRGGGVAKGNAQIEVDVDVDGEVVSLGSNVHVATGEDPDP